MNNKEKFIKANNEIKTDEKIKQKLFENLENKHKSKIIYKLASITAVIVLVFSLINLNNINTIQEIKEPKENKSILLPKVENFDTLKQILEKSADRNDITMDAINATSKLATNVESFSDFSNTNVQVEGVDEADIVKTDGEFIYYILYNKLVIINAKDKNNLTLETKIEFTDMNFLPFTMFLYNDKLIINGSISDIRNYSINNKLTDSNYLNFESKNKTLIYDITNKKDIKLIREVDVSGNLISSRMIGSNLYLALNKNIYYFLEKGEEYFKPTYKDTLISNEEKKINYEDIYYFPDSNTNNYLIIAAIDVNNNNEIKTETFLGAGNTIYASLNNLYVVTEKYEKTTNNNEENTIARWNPLSVKTEIYKFKLEETNVEYVAKGEVNGKILNQFSMDEYNGYFRIATTQKPINNEKSYNNMYVLDENLKLIGSLEKLAEDEKIYSVRFMKEKAYMVTFKQVDPLFVIDLANPSAPRVLGELKIPGFSDYLHTYKDNYVIGFGKHTETNENNVISSGIKLSLFDVTDLENPKELFSKVIGGRGTYSQASNNHKAFLFIKNRDIIAFPINIYNDYVNELRGAMVFSVSVEEGFKLKGTIEEDKKEYAEIYRVIYIGDTLFSVSEKNVKSVDLNTMNVLNTIEI